MIRAYSIFSGEFDPGIEAGNVLLPCGSREVSLRSSRSELPARFGSSLMSPGKATLNASVLSSSLFHFVLLCKKSNDSFQ